MLWTKERAAPTPQRNCSTSSSTRTACYLETAKYECSLLSFRPLEEAPRCWAGGCERNRGCVALCPLLLMPLPCKHCHKAAQRTLLCEAVQTRFCDLSHCFSLSKYAIMSEFMDYSDNPWSALIRISGISSRMSLIGALHRQILSIQRHLSAFFSACATAFTKKSLI